jgi:transcriptional regulator with PAS, ATPase and Fis domain
MDVLDTEQHRRVVPQFPTTTYSTAAADAQNLLSIMGTLAIVESAALHQVLHMTRRAAATPNAVLILGESGTGKELIARAVHQFSARSAKPWVDINCAALPSHLLESELFGYERGAFSGAESAKPGMFELAQGGTLFLDEIGELELGLQAKLLRILDGSPFFRLGGTRKCNSDVRIVAATNSDLRHAVQQGRFRQDLYHRLNQIHLRVPPLRERPEDIEPLALYFLKMQNPSLRFSPDAVAILQSYSWPGNVRELRNAVAMAAIFGSGYEIEPRHLPAEICFTPAANPLNDSLRLDGLEQQTVLKALRQTGGRQDRAAELLGISRRTLIRKLKVYAQQGIAATPRAVALEAAR